MNTSSDHLIGKWRQISPDTPGEQIFMEFKKGGDLEYRIETEEKSQIINLVYKVDGDLITTDQPSNPREEITKYSFMDNGVLVLDCNGELIKFVGHF